MMRMILILAMMICFTMNTKAEINAEPKTAEAITIETLHSIEKSQSQIAREVSSLAEWNKVSIEWNKVGTIVLIVSVSFNIILNLALLLSRSS
ncbi:hypothetical protein AGMMS49573_10180 [Endomicrobiia bacterium]|nr:hypothetical protein AGMMS49573_10180 [Endomicrobiia bacterium]